MSDEEQKERPKFKVLEGAGDNVKILSTERDKEQKETNEALYKMFTMMAERAKKGEIDGFVMTLRTTKGAVESLIGGIGRGFDFVGYIGMLELLKDRLIELMAQFSYMYYSTEDKPEGDDDGPKQP